VLVAIRYLGLHLSALSNVGGRAFAVSPRVIYVAQPQCLMTHAYSHRLSHPVSMKRYERLSSSSLQIACILVLFRDALALWSNECVSGGLGRSTYQLASRRRAWLPDLYELPQQCNSNGPNNPAEPERMRAAMCDTASWKLN
jgi:hypothetical protein